MFNTRSIASHDKENSPMGPGPRTIHSVWFITPLANQWRHARSRPPARRLDQALKVVGAKTRRRAAPLKFEFMFRFCIAF